MITRATLLLTATCLAACAPQATPGLFECGAFDEQHSCASVDGPVCARVDTGVRCITTPCPSSVLKPYPDACTACGNSKVDVVFTGSCELLQQQLEKGGVQ
jgi:hypothetical protein